MWKEILPDIKKINKQKTQQALTSHKGKEILRFEIEGILNKGQNFGYARYECQYYRKEPHKTYQAQAKIKQAKIEYHLNYSRPINSAPKLKANTHTILYN